MRTLALLALLCSPAFAADPLASRVFVEINLSRTEHDLATVQGSAELTAAAELIAEWNAWATRKQIDYPEHSINTAWLLERHPELLWERLRATFQCGLPETIVAHDVARLCGWTGGFAIDIGYLGRAKASRAISDWERSTHSQVLWGEYDVCGVGTDGAGSNTWIFAVFGVTF